MTFRKSLLTTLILVGIIPMLFIGLISTSLTVKSLQKKGIDTLLSTAQANGSAFEGYWDSQIREAKLLSSDKRISTCLLKALDGTITDEEFNECNLALSGWVALSGSYLYAYLLDEDGYIISSSDVSMIGTYFGKIDTHPQAVQVLEDNGATIMRISHMAGSEAKNGILILESRLNFYDIVLNNISIGSSSASYIFSKDGHIICGSERHLIMDEYEEIPINQMVADFNEGKIEKSGTDKFTYDSKNFFMSYYIIEQMDWIFITTQMASDINQPMNYIWIAIVIIFIAALIAIIVICGILVNKFMSPINVLLEVFHKATMEKRYIACEIPGNNEFTALASGYNAMIRKLNENHEKLDELYQEIASQEEELRQNYLLLGEEHQKIEQLALSDFVTGLDNRQSFEQKLRIMLDEYPSLGFISLDLDGFKAINDIYGHLFGDSCLIETAARLSTMDIELDVLARFGADEFYAVKVGTKEEVARAVEEMVKIIDKPFIIDDTYIHLTACAGVSVYPDDGIDLVDVMRNTDLALTQAKSKGRNQVVFFESDMQKNLERRQDVLRVVQNAVENNEIFAVYQPEISVKDGKIYGFETLMRMISRELGFLSPTEFIPITESSGDIIALGRWIMIKACLFAKRLIDEGNQFNVISVNVSLVQLNEPDFASAVLEILEATELPPNYLQIEITESVLMADSDKNVDKLNELRIHGITIALDDFGTGYSAMSYLFELPIDVLKIDKSFIDDISTDSNKQTVCRSIIDMAHALKMKVVAEGIELDEQRIMLEEMGCDMIQGYLYSRPVNENDAVKLFEVFK